jgi:broad specificity phosphatase PhoE
MAAQLIHVVRHAHAGDPAAWTLDDDLRPLSDRGCGQAERLPSVLRGDPPAVIYSSPSLRCLATVLPLARLHGVAVTTLATLYEGNRASAMLQRLQQDPSPVVACTHGDVITDLLDLVRGNGIELQSPRAEKGATWTIEISSGRISSARYVPPP